MQVKCSMSLQIFDHLTLLQKKHNQYFSYFEIQDYDWITNPVILTDTRNLFLTEENEVAVLKNDQSLLMVNNEGVLDSFRVRVVRIHLNIAKKR